MYNTPNSPCDSAAVRYITKAMNNTRFPRYLLLSALTGLMLATAPLSAHAQAKADFLGAFGNWEAYSTDAGGKLCYIAAVPTKSEGKYTRRGVIFLLVSHRPQDNSTGVVSLEAGYSYGPKSKITAKIGGKSYAMFPDGGHSFAYEDAPLVNAMIRGSDIVIQGTSSRGTLTTDTFSLTGFTAAYKAASTACGVK